MIYCGHHLDVTIGHSFCLAIRLPGARSRLLLSRNARDINDTVEDNYFAYLEDLDARITTIFNLLQSVPNRVNALNDSYHSFETSLAELEATADRKLAISFSRGFYHRLI